MCKNCDTTEARAQITEIFDAVGLSDLAGRFMAARFADVPEGSDKFSDPATHGTVTLTVGQYHLLVSGVMLNLDRLVSDGGQAVAMSRMMGVPMDALVDTSECRELLTELLDALDAIKAAPASEVVIPDDIAALVGSSDGTTTTGE